MSIAFAPAGLGGFNAHGAGFLAAAKAWGIQPELVTATSGQFLVLADWLRGADDLRASLILPSRDGNPVAQLQTMLFGYPGVFKPAYPQAFAMSEEKFAKLGLRKPVKAAGLKPAPGFE